MALTATLSSCTPSTRKASASTKRHPRLPRLQPVLPHAGPRHPDRHLRAEIGSHLRPVALSGILGATARSWWKCGWPTSLHLSRGIRYHTPGVDQRLPSRRFPWALTDAASLVQLHNPVSVRHAQRVIRCCLVRPAGRPQSCVGGLGLPGPDTFAAAAFGSPLGLYAVDDRLRRRFVRLRFPPPIESHHVTPALFAVCWSHPPPGLPRRARHQPGGEADYSVQAVGWCEIAPKLLLKR